MVALRLQGMGELCADGYPFPVFDAGRKMMNAGTPSQGRRWSPDSLKYSCKPSFFPFLPVTPVVGVAGDKRQHAGGFGIDHLLFGTDMPFDEEIGAFSVRNTINSVEHMNIPNSEKQLIYEGNARRLLRLK